MEAKTSRIVGVDVMQPYFHQGVSVNPHNNGESAEYKLPHKKRLSQSNQENGGITNANGCNGAGLHVSVIKQNPTGVSGGTLSPGGCAGSSTVMLSPVSLTSNGCTECGNNSGDCYTCRIQTDREMELSGNYGQSRSTNDPFNQESSSRTRNSDSSASVSPTSGGAGGSSKSRSTKDKEKRICGVCYDIAKSCHFGGLSCDSCKAFFRRSVHKDAYLQFTCGYDGHCEITKSTRKSCQKCRFEKCESIGMMKKWVMTEEERIEKNNQRNEKKMREMAGSNGGSSNEASHNFIPDYPNPEVEKDHNEFIPRVEDMLNYMTQEEQNSIREIVEFYRFSYDKIPYTVTKTAEVGALRNSIEVISMFTTILRRFAYFSKFVPEFRDLCKGDQASLLRASVLEMCLLRGALCFDAENHRWPNTNLEFLKNCPQLKVSEMKNLASPELFDMHMKFISKMQQFKVDEPTVMLLLIIVMFSGDKLQLEEERKISDAQDKYSLLLQKYMNWRYGPMGSTLYPKVLGKLTDLRQLNDLHTEYSLNLGEEEVKAIQENLRDLKLDPYPQWKIVNQEQSTGSKGSPQFPTCYSPPSTGMEPSPPPVPHQHAWNQQVHDVHESPPPPPSQAFHEQRKRMRQMFLNRIPELIEDPFAPLITESDMREAAARFGGFANPGGSGNDPSPNFQNQPSQNFNFGGRPQFDPVLLRAQPPEQIAPRSHSSDESSCSGGHNLPAGLIGGGGIDFANLDPKRVQNFMQNMSAETRNSLRAMFCGNGAPTITPGLFTNIVSGTGDENLPSIPLPHRTTSVITGGNPGIVGRSGEDRPSATATRPEERSPTKRPHVRR